MKPVTLAQFQATTGLSDAALALLLKRNQLPCSLDTTMGIMVDVSSVAVQSLITAIAERHAQPPMAVQEIISERVGGLIADCFERVKAEALKLANDRKNPA